MSLIELIDKNGFGFFLLAVIVILALASVLDSFADAFGKRGRR